MSENLEAVVSRYSRRPGYDLLTYREVGLPFWEFPLNCRFLRRKALPALDEFVLRTVDAGLHREDEVMSFLGLPSRVLEAVMGGLVSSGHLAPVYGSDDTGLSFSLSQRGRAAVVELSETVPEERPISLAFDGLLRSFRLVENSLRWRPRDMRDSGVLEIPAFPADPPDAGPTDTTEVARVIASVLAETDSELLAVLGLADRRQKFFMRALALVFQPSDRSGDISVNFFVDGRPSPGHDQAFAAAEGRRKLGVLGDLNQDGLQTSQKLVSRELLEQLSDPSEVATLRRVTEDMRERYVKLRDQGPDADLLSTDVSGAEVDDTAARLETAESVLERLPVRILEVHEHPALLRDALANAQHRLLIVSPWIRAAVVDQSFIERLEVLLQAGVDVTIAHGIDDGARTPEWDRQVENKLERLSEKHATFKFVRLGDTHAKVLVVDDRHVVVTSFNWLSYQGDPNRPFRDERGTLVTVVDEIERLYQDYMARIAKAATQK